MSPQPNSGIEKDIQQGHPQTHGAHSGFRRGMSDYNDGANVTDQLGNDDQNPNVGVFNSGTEVENEVGKVAFGNQELQENK